jgi:hypothetical protein
LRPVELLLAHECQFTRSSLSEDHIIHILGHMAGSNAAGMVDPQIFEDIQAKIDEDAQVKEQIRAILQILERQGRTAQSILSRAHSTPTSKRKQS